jgi:tetratricopeptide (TPR) repeat protein
MSERWQRVDDLFARVLARDPRERSAFLQEACRDDDGLRQEVESLVRHAEAASGQQFLAVPARPGRDRRPGDELGRYRIESWLGAGGMGEVYRARDLRLGRPVALKLLPDQLLTDSDRIKRFEREARTASSLNHPNIVTIHEIGHADGVHFIAQEFVEGTTLRHLMADGPLAPSRAIDVGRQMATALAAAHAAGIIHRDIKPENVMVRPDGYLKILDFGLAKLSEADGRSDDHPTATDLRTATGLIFGTTRYMSPEQARGLSVDARSDLFSLGVVLYEITAGQPPFTGATQTDVLAAIIGREPTPLGQIATDVPAELERIVERLLQKAPEARYQTAQQVLADLQQLSADLAHVAGARPVRTRGPVRRVAPAALAVVGVAVIVALFSGERTPALTGEDTILLTDFVNATGESAFDGSTLKQGLSVQLSQTPFINLVPDEAVRTALGLMTRSPDERVTREIGLEICRRQGLKALVSGTIAKLGRRYVITLEAVEAASGRPIALEQVEAADQEEVLTALGRAATGLRQKLGESLSTLQQFNASIEQATTGSLEALKAYSAGMESMYVEDGRAALPLFIRATEIDPMFVAAYDFGAWAAGMTGNLVQAVALAERGFQLRDRATEREALSVASTYHHFATGDLAEENRVCGVFKRLYPKDWVPYSCFAINYLYWMGRFEEAASESRAIIRLSPNISQGYRFLAPALIGLNQFDEALTVADQAHARGLDNQFLRNARYRIAHVKGDAPALQRTLEAIRQQDGENPARLLSARTAAFAGRWREAQALFAAGTARPIEAIHVGALLGFCKPTSAEIREILAVSRIRAASQSFSPAVTTEGALCGDAAEAGRFADEFARRFPVSTSGQMFVPFIRAAIDLKRLQPEQAIERLNVAAMPSLRTRFLVLYLRGQAFLRMGRAGEARVEFQTIVDHRGWDTMSVVYPLAYVGLARAAVVAGDRAAARSAYESLFSLWKDADADVPVLSEAKRQYSTLR